MHLTPEDITIAITVFNRRQYLKQAIASALEQTRPVRVIVVEDCGPDPELERVVRREFGSRVEYFRNPVRRGLFGNWNACMEYGRTSWLSILHDDDFLAPEFVEAMLELSRHAPECGLYFGRTSIVDEAARPTSFGVRPPHMEAPWERVTLRDTLEITPFPFPGHLFRVDYARAQGSFRVTSQYCGDWEMWARLIAHYGAARTKVTVAHNRSHFGGERGTMKILLNGRLRPLTFVQQKRIVHLLRKTGTPARFDRAELLGHSPMSIRDLLRYGPGFTPRLFDYHVGLLRRSPPPGAGYALFQALTRVFGKQFVRLASRLSRHE